MTCADLDDLTVLLGDPAVMRFYPQPKTRDEAKQWIAWTLRNYDSYGFGLWVIERVDDGLFVGDCGLTWQRIDGRAVLEVGYHVLPTYQGQGLATEAAAACLEFAFGAIGADYVTAIVNPENAASRRVASNIGMTVETHTNDADGRPLVLYSVARS